MATRNMLYQNTYPINEHIQIMIPKVGDVLEQEDVYYNLVTVLTAMPIDLMVELDEAHIDFTSINEYELFLLMFDGLQRRDTSLVFGNLDLTKFVLEENPSNGHFILKNPETGAVIDKLVHNYIASVLRKIHHLEKNRRKPANDEAKAYMLERARAKRKRNRNRSKDSELESLIVAMVNTEQYKYDFEGTRELSIYQFNESVRQVLKKVDYDNRMFGVYTGNINPKELSQSDLNWLTHK